MFNNERITSHLTGWEQDLENWTLPTWEQLPTIDLYMEQVVALLTQYLDFLSSGDKKYSAITVSTVNNYVRMKVMPAPHKKKYGKLHLAYLIIICTLKQSLSIAHIQKLIPPDLTEEEMHTLYNEYVADHRNASLFFLHNMRAALKSQFIPEEDTPEGGPMKKFIVTSAIVAGYTNFMAEQLINLQEDESE